MKNWIGPFTVIALTAEILTAGIFGAVVFFSTTPWWAWAIVGAVLLAAWLVDRLLFWGATKMQERTLDAQREHLSKTHTDFRAYMKKVDETLAKRKKSCPKIPTPPIKDEDLN